MMDVSLLKLCQLLPDPLLVLVELAEPHVDVALLNSLDKDEDFLLTLHATGEGTERHSDDEKVKDESGPPCLT